MFSRFSATAVFLTIFSVAASATADDLARIFSLADKPQAVAPLQFNDGKGRERTMKEFKGRYVLLNLWATWCGPCVKEMPSLNLLQTKFDDRELTVIALNENTNGAAAAEAFYRRYELKNLPVYVDTGGRAPYLMKAHGLPTTILIDPEGREIGRVEGEVDWAAPDMIESLKSRIKR